MKIFRKRLIRLAAIGVLLGLVAFAYVYFIGTRTLLEHGPRKWRSNAHEHHVDEFHEP
jgi:hypothetical protein